MGVSTTQREKVCHLLSPCVWGPMEELPSVPENLGTCSPEVGSEEEDGPLLSSEEA